MSSFWSGGRYTVPVWKYINLVVDCGLGLIGCRPGGGGAGGGCGSLAGG